MSDDRVKQLRDLVNDFAGWIGAAATIVTVLISLLPPRFLNHETTRYLSIAGGIIGIYGGTLWGLHLRNERRIRGWMAIAGCAIASALIGVVILSIASGELPGRFAWLVLPYDVFHAAPKIGDALFAASYAIFWGAIASFIRFLPK